MNQSKARTLGLTRREFLKGSALTMGILSLGLSRGLQLYAQTNASLLIEPDELTARLAPALSGCPEALAMLLATLRVVDFREQAPYLNSHIPTAVNLWYPEITVERNGVPGLVAPQEIIERVFGQAGLDRSLEAVIYSDNGNLWAARLFWVLDYYGSSNIRILDGGMARWTKGKRAVTSSIPQVSASHFQSEQMPEKLVDADWILANLQNPKVVFVDARSTESYEAGHLPGAISKPWKENINWDDESFKPYDQLLTRFKDGGVTPDKTVISYCQTGVQGAHNYYTLRLLDYPDVRLYDGSWADWTSVPGRPVEKGG